MEGVKKSQFRADVLSGWPLNECPLLCKGFFGEFPATYTKVFTKILTSKVDFFSTQRNARRPSYLFWPLWQVQYLQCQYLPAKARGLFLTPKRQRLAADLIECMIIISQNSHLLGFDDC